MLIIDSRRVVDAVDGDVYGMVVAGSTGLGEEYIIPAVNVGRDIREVMRADSVRLPSWHDVLRSHRRSEHMDIENDVRGWESDENADVDSLEEEEEVRLFKAKIDHATIRGKNKNANVLMLIALPPCRSPQILLH